MFDFWFNMDYYFEILDLGNRNWSGIYILFMLYVYKFYLINVFFLCKFRFIYINIGFEVIEF